MTEEIRMPEDFFPPILDADKDIRINGKPTEAVKLVDSAGRSFLFNKKSKENLDMGEIFLIENNDAQMALNYGEINEIILTDSPITVIDPLGSVTFKSIKSEGTFVFVDLLIMTLNPNFPQLFYYDVNLRFYINNHRKFVAPMEKIIFNDVNLVRMMSKTKDFSGLKPKADKEFMFLLKDIISNTDTVISQLLYLYHAKKQLQDKKLMKLEKTFVDGLNIGI